jgi:hypothetical protein
MDSAPAPPELAAGEPVELAGDESNRTTADTNPEEGEAEPWVDRRARRTIQRVFSQALDRQAGTLKRRRHRRPRFYSGQREPVRVARARTTQQEDSVDA